MTTVKNLSHIRTAVVECILALRLSRTCQLQLPTSQQIPYAHHTLIISHSPTGPTSTYPQQVSQVFIHILTKHPDFHHYHSDYSSSKKYTLHGCYGAIPPTTKAPQSAAARRLPPQSAAPAAPPSGCRRSPGPGRPGARMRLLTCTFLHGSVGEGWGVWGANLENDFEQMDIGEMDLGEFCAVE